MGITEKIRELSDREKAGLGLLALFFGNKVLNGIGTAILFVVWIAVIIAFIGFALLMAFLTGEFG